ncbi:P-selectin isoform X3 [Acanthopagrus latus]|uniref:P-selectin isoform X3 n=1 Tax=Acanthopagrus latus TaxID=8177 RepID=UPI00187CCC3C|nr:P-selectin isoform X3 [Acanthopagrus latus]
MMLEESVDTRQRLHHRVLIAALIAFAQDLSGRGGAQAWTYNYSTSPNRRWLEASQWCQQHFTGMVAIQNQEESDFINNLLPFHPKYYWIGIRKVDGGWLWDGTREKLPEEAQNWAPGEPDDIAGQDCVEIYIKREIDTAKWNNENCRKKKGTICYSASCKQDSCSAHADCVETIGSHTCLCHPGFLGSRCEEAITCSPLLDPEQSSHYCFHPYGPNRFNSSCLYHCELGFQLVGVSQLLCQASGHWNHPVPLCQAEQCPVLNHTNIDAGSMNCSHPIAPYSYNSTCEVQCDEGYEPSGHKQIRCDHTGQWTASVPTCKVKKCSPITFPDMGNMTCVDALETFSFGSSCNFACQEGYNLTGDNTLTCLASKQWSKPTPTCTVVKCDSLKAPPHASLQCHDPLGAHSYGSICTMQCEEGFDLIGTNMTKCSSRGSWTHALPSCQAKRCIPLNPPHGSISCSDPNGPFSFGSRCAVACDEGFVLLNGTASTECNSLGMWSADIARCLAKRCPTLISPSHGSLICSDPHEEFSFASRCRSTCEEGFVLNGTADTECTSLGTWSTDIPSCFAKRCPTLNSPSHGSLVCSAPHGDFSFGSRCTSACQEGFVLNGTADIECTSLGTWSADMPPCLAKRCPTLNSPSHGSLVCSAPHGDFSFGSRCTSACQEGFVLNGTADIECTSLGTWSADMPPCLAKRCPTLISPSHGSLICSDPHEEFSFASRCRSTCDEGFVLNGTADTECTSLGTWSTDVPSCHAKRCPTLNSPSHGSLVCSAPHGDFSFGSRCTSACQEGFVLNGTAATECTSLGTWSTDIPRCLAQPCPLLSNAPKHGRMNCSHPHSPFSYSSHCDFECSDGFWLRGASSMTCNTSGHWSQDLPACQPVQCKAIRALSLVLSMNCSHPLGDFSFGSQCRFTCRDGYSLNGTEVLSCSSTGFWNGSLPSCKVEGMPVGTAMLMYTGVGAAAVVVPLVLIGLVLLIMTRFKKRGNPLMSDAPGWGDRENPAFEF